MAQKVRVRKPGQHALLNPATGVHETPGSDDYFADDHPLVVAHRWAFATDAELAEAQVAARTITSVAIEDVVEQATRAPGEKRGTRRS